MKTQSFRLLRINVFFIGPFAPTSIDQSWLRKLLARSFDEAFCEVQFCFGSINIVGGVESFPKLQSQTAEKKVSQWKVPSWELTYPPQKALLKMIFLFPRWDMLVPWRVFHQSKLMLDPKNVSPSGLCGQECQEVPQVFVSKCANLG